MGAFRVSGGFYVEHESDCLILDYLPGARTYVLYCDEEDGRRAVGAGFHHNPEFSGVITRKRKIARKYRSYATKLALWQMGLGVHNPHKIHLAAG